MSGDVLFSSPQKQKLRETRKQIPKKVPLKEEQYLSNLLAKCMCQVEEALTLQPDCVSDSDSKDVLLTRSLQTHHLLCEGLERAEDTQGDADAQLKKEVKNSYKNVLRCSRDIPGASANMKHRCDKDMGKLEQLFTDSFKAAIRSVFERGEQEDALLKVTPFQVPKNEATLDERIASVTKKISCTDAKILDCKARIEELKTPIVFEEPLTDEEYQSHLNTPQQISLQNELDHLTVQLNKLFQENRDTERDISEGTNVVEEEIEYITERFDEKMEVSQANVEVKGAEQQSYEEEIMRLEELLAPLEEEYKEIVAKREKADEKMRKEQQIVVAQTKAALIAQSWWRGHCVRKAMKNKDKKGKGKKGKGKKK